jgi:tetratricopeptide (TPR) repeat protein
MTLIIENSGERAGIEDLWERYGSAPESTEFMALAEQLRRRGCQGEAVDICTRAKDSYPQYVSCRVLLGRCLMELGLRDEALRELEEVLELDRENAFSLQVMAELRMAQGNLSEAANYYRALVRINPSDLDMQQKLAQVVRALEPAGDDASLPVGQEAAARPSLKRAPQPEPRPAILGIEAAVEKALEELQRPETLVPTWHMEDRAAGASAGAQLTATASPRPSVSAGRA